MNALLETLVMGLISRKMINTVRPDHAVDSRDLTESDSDFRQLANLLGRPLESWEAVELSTLDAWDGVAEELLEAIEAQAAPVAAERVEDKTADLRRQIDQAEDSRAQAEDRARAAEREIEALRGDVRWLKRELCQKAGTAAAAATPSALLALRSELAQLEADRREAERKATALRVAISDLDQELFARSDSLRYKVSTHGHEVGRGKAYPSRRAVADDEVRSTVLSEVCNKLSRIVTPAPKATRAA